MWGSVLSTVLIQDPLLTQGLKPLLIVLTRRDPKVYQAADPIADSHHPVIMNFFSVAQPVTVLRASCYLLCRPLGCVSSLHPLYLCLSGFLL